MSSAHNIVIIFGTRVHFTRKIFFLLFGSEYPCDIYSHFFFPPRAFANGFGGIAGDVGGVFGAGGIPLVTTETLYYLRSYAVLLIAALVGSTPVVKTAAQKISPKITNVLITPVMLVLLVLCTAYLVDGSFNPFLYFRF